MPGALDELPPELDAAELLELPLCGLLGDGGGGLITTGTDPDTELLALLDAELDALATELEAAELVDVALCVLALLLAELDAEPDAELDAEVDADRLEELEALTGPLWAWAVGIAESEDEPQLAAASATATMSRPRGTTRIEAPSLSA